MLAPRGVGFGVLQLGDLRVRSGPSGRTCLKLRDRSGIQLSEPKNVDSGDTNVGRFHVLDRKHNTSFPSFLAVHASASPACATSSSF